MNESVKRRVIEYWDRGAPEFDAIYSGRKSWLGQQLDGWLRRDMFQRFDWVMNQVDNVAGKTVCDLGCGTGRYVVSYATRGARRVVGIDSSAKMLQIASALSAETGVVDHCEFRQGDILRGVGNEYYDVVLAVGVFDYISDPLVLLKNVQGMCRQSFLATFPALWTWRMPVRKFRLGILGCPVYFYTRERIVELLNQIGFECQRIDRIGAIFCVHAIQGSR